MKYIIMCGGQYDDWAIPRQLTEVSGEPVVARTIRLLKEAGITDIAISSNNQIFNQFGVPVLRHDNGYRADGASITSGYWCEAFYPTNEPTCYIFGDVVFSPEAIKTIVETGTDDIEFFASAPPFSMDYMKPWAEPFALKVVDPEHLRDAIDRTIEYADQGRFLRKPIMWELWQVIKGTPLNEINFENYVIINDYTCDIDRPEDAAYFRNIG